MRLLKRAFWAGAIIAGLTTGAVAQVSNLKMATIAPGTSAYLAMSTMATLVNEALEDVSIQVDATGAATRHMVDVAQGKLDMAMTSPTIYKFMKNQTAMYKKMDNAPELAENLSLLFWFPLGQYHIVTYASDNITSIKDIAGKKVFLGPPGGGAWAAANRWVKMMTGYTVDEDYENVKASWSSAFQGFQDRQFDVYVITGIAPFPQLEQLSLTSELRILGLSQEEYETNKTLTDYIENTQGRELGIIPTGVYGDGVVNKEDVYTIGSVVGVTIRADMDEDLVYRITKSFWESHEAALDTHPWLGDLTRDYAVQEGGMKLHPGALRYYQEIGLNIPAGSM